MRCGTSVGDEEGFGVMRRGNRKKLSWKNLHVARLLVDVFGERGGGTNKKEQKEKHWKVGGDHLLQRKVKCGEKEPIRVIEITGGCGCSNHY